MGDILTNHVQLQACLKEIHAKMLRKHLQRLEKPLEVEDAEEEWSPKPNEEDADHDGEGMDVLP